MKRPLHATLLLLFCFTGGQVLAQAPFNTMELLDVNNISVAHLVHGDMWHHPDSMNAKCEFPKGSGNHIGFTGSLWMGGYTTGGQLTVAAQTYRQDGNDYWPGPLEISTPISYVESEKWARIWKITRDEINTFLATPNHTIANTPASILEWPGTASTSAIGANGVSLTIPMRALAPFVDVNQNGIYEPLSGDYPAMKGDMMLWNIFNDNGPTHQVSNTDRIGAEVHCMAYAYKRNSKVDNIIFYEYKIINRTNVALDSFAVGFFADLALGYSGDDYVGFDSARRLGYYYNGNMIDGTGGNGYGANIPVAGIKVLQMPGDTCDSTTPLESFMVYHNNNSPTNGNPSNGTQHNNLIRHHWRNGQPLTNDFQGGGIASDGTGSGPEAQYIFSGDPSVAGEWSECASNNPVFDSRMVFGSKAVSLQPGTTWRFAIALVADDPSLHNACPNIDITGVQEVADTAQKIFCNPLLPLTGINNIAIAKSQLLIYPNPAADMVTINHPLRGTATVRIFDAVGRVVATTETEKQNTQVHVAMLPHGVYHVILSQNEQYFSGTFVKE